MTDINKADVAIARIEKATGPLRAEQKQFLIDHEEEYSKYEGEANIIIQKWLAGFVLERDTPKLMTDFDADICQYPHYKNKSRDAQPNRNPFAEKSLRRQTRGQRRHANPPRYNCSF